MPLKYLLKKFPHTGFYYFIIVNLTYDLIKQMPPSEPNVFTRLVLLSEAG